MWVALHSQNRKCCWRLNSFNLFKFCLLNKLVIDEAARKIFFM